jgi:hypothetical protein
MESADPRCRHSNRTTYFGCSLPLLLLLQIVFQDFYDHYEQVILRIWQEANRTWQIEKREHMIQAVEIILQPNNNTTL